MQCIGVDVGKQALVTYDGEKERVFPNRKDLPEFTEFVNHGREVLIVFEATSTYSRRLEALCREKNILTVKLNPRLIPSLREVEGRRSKTDHTDAELLYRYGVERGKDEARRARSVDRLTQAVSAQLAIYRVTQKARVSYQGLLEALSQDPSTPKEVLEELTETVTSLKEKEQECITQAQKLIKEEEAAAQSFQVLMSIPGVGPVTAITLVALFRRYPGTNRKQIVALQEDKLYVRCSAERTISRVRSARSSGLSKNGPTSSAIFVKSNPTILLAIISRQFSAVTCGPAHPV